MKSLLLLQIFIYSIYYCEKIGNQPHKCCYIVSYEIARKEKNLPCWTRNVGNENSRAFGLALQLLLGFFIKIPHRNSQQERFWQF